MLLPVLLAATLMAQTPRSAFEAASVKPASAECGNAGSPPAPGRLALPCTTLRNLIRIAYGTFTTDGIGTRRMEVTGGPAWLDSERFEISAKAAAGSSVAEMSGPMMQSLLEDRFQVKVHREPREQSVYVMTVVKNSNKLHESKEGTCVALDVNHLPRGDDPSETAVHYCGFGPGRQSSNGIVMDWYGTSMAELAGRMLSAYVDRPVVDRTGLSGKYDFHVEVPRETIMAGRVRLNGVEVAPGAADTAPSIFTVFQEQLGLKLTPEKAPIEVIVVDRAEKPSTN